MKKITRLLILIFVLASGCNPTKRATDWDYKHKHYSVRESQKNPYIRRYKYKPKY